LTLGERIHLRSISDAFAGEGSLPPADETLRRAAVAMLLRGAPPFEIFFIVRARHDDDPWSGDIGFPGGKLETGETPRHSAERETREEVGIDLTDAVLLGALEPIRGAHLPVEIHALIYHLPRTPETTCNHEVSRAFWMATESLLQAERFGDFPVRFGTKALVRPGIRILDDHEPVLWGITFRLLQQFFTSLGIPFPPVD